MKNGLTILVVIIILIALVPLINKWQQQKLATDLAIAKANADAQREIADDAARVAEANKPVQQQPTLYYIRVPYYVPYPYPHPNPPPPPPPPPPMM